MSSSKRFAMSGWLYRIASFCKSEAQFHVKWNDIRRTVSMQSIAVQGSKFSFVIPNAMNSGGKIRAVLSANGIIETP